MKLREICNNNTATQLKEIAKSHGLSGYSKMKKAELVDLVAGHLLNYDTIEESLLLAEDREMAAFEEVCKGQQVTLEGDATNYIYFFMKGYYNINANQEISVPDEIRRMFPLIYSSQLKEQRTSFHRVLDYCKAGVNLYGIVSIEQIVKYYNQNNKGTITKEQLIACVEYAQKRDCVVEMKGDYFIHELLTTNERAFDILLSKQGNKPFYQPSKNEYLKFAEDTYVETNEYYERMHTYLKTVLFMSDEMAETVLGEIEASYSEGKDCVQIVELLEKQGLEFTTVELKQGFIQEVINYTNYIRLWENRGNHKVELGLASNPSNVINLNQTMQRNTTSDKKVGRNEPCPCGSGKKYKFCCGK